MTTFDVKQLTVPPIGNLPTRARSMPSLDELIRRYKANRRPLELLCGMKPRWELTRHQLDICAQQLCLWNPETVERACIEAGMDPKQEFPSLPDLVSRCRKIDMMNKNSGVCSEDAYHNRPKDLVDKTIALLRIDLGKIVREEQNRKPVVS